MNIETMYQKIPLYQYNLDYFFKIMQAKAKFFNHLNLLYKDLIFFLAIFIMLCQISISAIEIKCSTRFVWLL